MMPAAGAVLPRPPTRCAACTRVLSLPISAGEFACECGVVHGVNISNEAEYRCFADEEGQEDKKRAENYTREDESRAPMPAGLASSDRMRKWADGRVNQVMPMLAHLDTEEPGRAVLSKDEVRAALGDVRAAAFHQASLPEDEAELHTASALLWAIAVAQNVATRRPGGWLVDSELSAVAWGMDALSEYFSCFQSESHVTAERLGNATQVRGGGIGRVAALVHDAKRRQLRIDSLGSAEARRTKLLALDALLLAAGRPGLDARVKQHRAWHKWCWRPLGPAPPRVPGLTQPPPPLRPLTCLRLALSQEPTAAAGSRAAPAGRHASLPGGAGEPVGRAACAAAQRWPCLWKAGERPPRAGESRTRQDSGRTQARRSFPVPHAFCARRFCAQCRPNQPHSNNPNSNLAQAKPPGALTAASASCASRPRPSPPPAHSDDHAPRAPAAVAQRVVAGGDGASGAQVSERAVTEELDADTDTDTEWRRRW